MTQEPVVIPEKMYFKIGEVCELVGVQAHVLRYWETEFPTLSPQKNSSGQRSYRRRDVEIALRIKQLLYNEMFTIAGARKKLQAEQREGSKHKPRTTVNVESSTSGKPEEPTLFDRLYDAADSTRRASNGEAAIPFGTKQHHAFKTLATHLLELREMLKTTRM